LDKMMNKKVVFGLVVLVALASVIAMVLSIPEKSANCGTKDGACPQGCSYASDADCLHSATTSMGEVKRCLSDLDCAAVSAICGNENCNFNDASCERGCSCGIAVNKDYKSVFESARVECLASGVAACAQCPEGTKAICISGECRIII